MKGKSVKKINVVYLLCYIFFPLLICAVCYLLSAVYYPIGTMAAVLIMTPTILSVLWWSFGGKCIYNLKKKGFEKKLSQDGFICNYTFYGRGCMVAIDADDGEIGLLFFWNPFHHHILPANRISKIWVNDGRSGKGFMEGSSQVSFNFIIDNIKVRVYTFVSNKRWKMDSNYIVNGVAKANKAVSMLEEARSQASSN